MSFSRYETIFKKMSIAALLIGILLHIIPYLAEHSLFVDDAMVASTIVTRDFAHLVRTPMDYGQSAPIGYLYAVKICTALFGVSKVSLRIYSLFCFFATCGLMYYVLSKMYQVKRAMFFTAVFSLLPFYIQYAAEVKQYTSECMFTLLTVIIFWQYFQDKISLLRLCLLASMIIWFAFAPVFFIASGMLLAVGEKLRKKDIKSLVACCLPVLSLVIYYLFWLSGTESNAGAKAYWDLLAFPLVPSSWEDIKLLVKMAKESIIPLGYSGIIYIFAAFYTLYLWRKEKRQEMYFYVLGCFLLLIASSLGYYPIIARLMAFFAMLVLILAAVSLDRLWNMWEENGRTSGQKTGALLCAAAILLGLPFLSTAKQYIRGNLLFNHGTEVVKNLKYLEKHKTDKDMIYLYCGAQPSYFFEQGFPYGGNNTWDMPKIGTVTDEYIWGKQLNVFNYKKPYSYEGEPDWENIRHDVNNIRQFDSVYLFTSHMNAERNVYWQLLLDMLKPYGTVEVVSSDHDTYLYHFQKKDEIG